MKLQSAEKSRDPRFQNSKIPDANNQNSVVQQPSVGSFDGASKGMAEEILPIFGQVSQSQSQQSEESVGFGLNRNKNKDSSSKNENNSDIHNVNRSGFKRETKTQDNEMKNGYGSFGSVGSIQSSPKNSKKSRKSGVVEKIEADSDFDSNGSVELLMMKSTKSAKIHLNQTDLETRRYSGLAMREKQAKPSRNYHKANHVKSRRNMVGYFKDSESLGHNDSGSNKISNLISQLGHGGQSQYSG